MPVRRLALASALLAAALTAGCDAAGPGSDAASADDRTTTRAEVAPPSIATGGEAFRPQAAGPRDGDDERRSVQAAEPRWPTARLTRRTALHARPGGRVLVRMRKRTEFGSPRILSVVRRRGDWLQVVATELPNGRRAWIRADDARIAGTDWSVHVDRSARRLVVRRAGRRVRTLPVAVGRAGTPTPLGRFSVTDKLAPQRSDSPYGCCIVALSGRQTRLVRGWPGGDRLAIHATPQAGTVGTAASLGCLRAGTSDMRVLMRRLPLGTPVFIRA